MKTTDGYVLRVFTVAFTKKTKGQTKKSAYAQSAQVRAIRKKMVEIITSTVQKCDLREFVAKHLLPETFKTDIENACKSIFPLQNVSVRKVKMLKSPKFDCTWCRVVVSCGYADSRLHYVTLHVRWTLITVAVLVVYCLFAGDSDEAYGDTRGWR